MRISSAWFRSAAASLVVLIACAYPVRAHAPGASNALSEGGSSVWRAWTFPPLVTFNMCLVGLLYAWGVRRIWRKAGTGNVISIRQAGAFSAGIAVLFLALVSPIDALADELSAVHMIQHMSIMNLAAPLLVLGLPGMAMLWTLPLSARRCFGGWRKDVSSGRALNYLLWQPLLLWSLYALVLWIWHLPALYEAALRHELFHDFQHLTFLLASCLFWRVLLDPLSRFRMSRAGTVLYLFFTSLHATVLGVFMALAPGVWYRTYEGRTQAWNLSALQDQQLAGLIMWMPACMVYAIVVALVLAFWLNEGSEPLIIPDGTRG